MSIYEAIGVGFVVLFTCFGFALFVVFSYKGLKPFIKELTDEQFEFQQFLNQRSQRDSIKRFNP